MRLRAWLVILLVIAASSLRAEVKPCTTPRMTVTDCFSELVPSTLEALLPDAEKQVAERAATEEVQVKAAPTGVPAIDSTAGSSLRDFLSRFLVGMENGNLSDDGNALTVDYNLRLSDLGKRVVKIQGVIRKPTLWEPFATSLDSDSSRDKLGGKLNDFDDITLSLTYAPENMRMGRSLEPHRKMFRAALNAVGSRTPSDALRELVEQFRAMKNANPAAFASVEDFDDLVFDDIKDLDAQEEIREKTIAAARGIVTSRVDFDKRYDAAGLNLFSDLLNNQPQLYVSLSTREREALVGPRGRSLKATYELGFVNLNSFRDEAGDQCDDMSSAACVAAFTDYAQRSDVQAGSAESNRVAISLEYNDLDDYDITGEDITTPFHVEGTRKWSGSIAYGRMLVKRDAATHDGRIDFSLTYEDLSSKDANVDNRWVASAIYTQKISDALSLPFGVVWSNHDADVPDSDKRVSAHFGLVFKMLQPK